MIMTELTQDLEARLRWSDERERVSRWNKKHLASKVYDKDVNYGKKCFKHFEFDGYKFAGTIPWVNPKNGDTWITVVTEKTTKTSTNIHREYNTFPFYYWQTIGSIGLYGRFKFIPNLDKPEEEFVLLMAVTSHTIYRVKERLNLPYEGLELLFYVSGMIMSARSVYYERDGEIMLELMCDAGLFRVPVPNDRNKLGTVRTFLTKESLSKKDRARYDEIMTTLRKGEVIAL